ncbi:hypothetical protein FRB99_005917 [Tulasnella sp. 403]|nr:hypothetical protein FRB99_005917 [Tulasnella sp. 403]
MPLLIILAPLVKDDDTRLAFIHTPTEPRWKRYYTYARRIRFLCQQGLILFGNPRLRFSELSAGLTSTLVDGLRYSPNGCLLPNIQACVCESNITNQLIDTISIFLYQTTTLKSLHIDANLWLPGSHLPLEGTRRLLDLLSENPSLRPFEFSITQYHPSHVRDIVKLLRNQRELSELTLGTPPQHGLATEFGDAFESLVDLEYLCLELSSTLINEFAMAIEAISRTKRLKKLFIRARNPSDAVEGPTTFYGIEPLLLCSMLQALDIYIPTVFGALSITPHDFQAMASAWPLLTHLFLYTDTTFPFHYLLHIARAFGHQLEGFWISVSRKSDIPDTTPIDVKFQRLKVMMIYMDLVVGADNQALVAHASNAIRALCPVGAPVEFSTTSSMLTSELRPEWLDFDHPRNFGGMVLP